MRTFLRDLFRPSSEFHDPSIFFSRPPQTETDRLLLRPLRMGDVRDIFEYGRDPQVAEHVLWDAYTDISDARAYLRWILRQYRDGQPCSVAIVYKETGQVIGTIGWMSWNPEHQVAEIGYSLSREYWNRGLMTEALSAMIRLSFEQLPVNRLEAVHETENPASGRVMEKCGMKKEGILRQRIRNKGRRADVVLYAILRDDLKSGGSKAAQD